MAIRKDSSSKRRPRDEMGMAFSHAPDSLVETARRRALDLALLVDERRKLALFMTLGMSHAFILEDSGWTGGASSRSAPHRSRAFNCSWSGVDWNVGGRILRTSWSDPSADARKADGARWTALRMPNPPCLLVG